MISMTLMWIMVAVATVGAIIFLIGMARFTNRKNRDLPLLGSTITWVAGLIIVLGTVAFMFVV